MWSGSLSIDKYKIKILVNSERCPEVSNFQAKIYLIAELLIIYLFNSVIIIFTEK